MTIEYRQSASDPRFKVRLAYGERAEPEPDAQLEALRARAGEILVGKGITTATTAQLMDAVKAAEAQLGFSYNEVQDRLRGVVADDAQTVSVLGAPMEINPDSIQQDLRVRAALKARGLTFETATQEEILEAASEVLA